MNDIIHNYLPLYLSLKLSSYEYDYGYNEYAEDSYKEYLRDSGDYYGWRAKYQIRPPMKMGYTERQCWGALRKSWLGYKIAKREEDYYILTLYARRIRYWQAVLGIKIADFPNVGLTGKDVDFSID